MKVETRQVPKYKLVEDGTEDKIVYVASDGKEFENEKAVEQYEAQLLSRSKFNEKYKWSYIEIDEKFYDVLVLPDLEKATLLEVCSKFRHISRTSLQKGINLIHTDDSGDHTWQDVLWPEAMIVNMTQTIKELQELIKGLQC